MPNKPQFLAQNGHDYSALLDHPNSMVGSYEDCARYNHEFFLMYDFILVNDQPFDPGNAKVDLESTPLSEIPKTDEGFKVFDDFVLYTAESGETLVAAFIHFEGTGPVARIRAL